MAQVKKPNTICRNPNCTHGEDGGRKHFYACLTCLRKESWRAYCCSIECYDEYTKAILDSRSKSNSAPLPERTDMTETEIKAVMEKPIEEVETYTQEVELKDYFEENPHASLSQVVELVNEDIDAQPKVEEVSETRRNRKRRYNAE